MKRSPALERLPLIGLCCLLMVAAACNRPRFDSPQIAYLSFVRLLQKDDQKAAYAALSEPTRKLVEARAQEARKLSGDSVAAEGPYHLFVGGLPPDPVEPSDISVAQQTETEATLSVKRVGGAQSVRLVKEAGAWRVDLTAELSRP